MCEKVMKKALVRRLVAVLLISVMLSAVLSACGAKTTPSETAAPQATPVTENTESEPQATALQASGETLVVGVQSSQISIPTVYAYDNGYFDELGLKVELVMFPNGSPENEGLAAGQLDVASNGLASVFTMASGLCYWIGETDTTVGTCALFARPDNPVFEHQGEIAAYPNMFGNAEVLKGQTILGPGNTVNMHLAYAYMDQFGLAAGKDFEFLGMDNAAAYQAFISGQGDMIGAASNFVSQLLDAGMKEVATYEDATGGTFLNGILARREVVEERRADVILFLQAMYKAADELMNDPDLRFEYSKQFFIDNGKEYTDEALKADIAKKDFVTLTMMQDPSYVFGLGMLNIGEFFAQIGTIETSQVDNVKTAIDPSVLMDAMDIEVQVP